MPRPASCLVLDVTLDGPSAAVLGQSPGFIRAEIRYEEFLVIRVDDDLVRVRALLAFFVWSRSRKRQRGELGGVEMRRLRAQGDRSKRARFVLRWTIRRSEWKARDVRTLPMSSSASAATSEHGEAPPLETRPSRDP